MLARQAPRHTLCITADDYGMHRVVNAAIEDLAACGAISAAAIMGHAGAVLDTRRLLVDSGVSCGLHLVFTQERPVSEAIAGTALAPDGRLLPTPYAVVRALWRRPALASVLRGELEAQLRRYDELDLPLHFVNSHEHVHEVPYLWDLVSPMVARRCPDAVRSAHVQPITPSRQGMLALLSRASRRRNRVPAGVRIMSPLGAGQAGAMDLRAVEALVDRGLGWHRRDGAVPELVVHPAMEDAPLHARYGAIAGARRAEYDLLRSAALRDALSRRHVELAFR